MTSSASTSGGVYIQVIEDVVNKMRQEFLNNAAAAGESLLTELQGLWEMKMMQAGAIVGPIDRSAVPPSMVPGGTPPVHDLNVPYEVYETPTADMLFPPTPLQTPLPGSVQTPSPYNIATGSSDYSSINDNGEAPEMKAGRPSPYMPPLSSWINQRPPLSVDVNVAYVEGRDDVDKAPSNQAQTQTQDFFMMSAGKRKRDDFLSQYQTGRYIPQQDGAGDAAIEFFQGSGSGISVTIPQLDGPIPDPYDDALSTPNMYNYQGVVNEDYNTVNTPAPGNTPAFVLQNENGDDDDEPPLNENDDDDDVEEENQEEDQNTQHLVLAQFDKVTRTKSRWKCTLKDGIMHINNKDILFNKANGEFEF